MRKKYIIANWKMNKSLRDLPDYLTELEKKVGVSARDLDLQGLRVVLAMPFTFLEAAARLLANRGMFLGAQNMHAQDKGAYTGEVSASMLKEVGVSYVLIGHSERRALFHEKNEDIAAKLKQAVMHQLKPVFCVGETGSERERGQTFAVIRQQLRQGLAELKDLSSLQIAYEPVWAIGTGQSASAQDAQEVHAFIRQELTEIFDAVQTEKLSLLYGGSVNTGNIASFLAQKDIDGALVGGASLDAQGFGELIHKSSKTA